MWIQTEDQTTEFYVEIVKSEDRVKLTWSQIHWVSLSVYIVWLHPPCFISAIVSSSVGFNRAVNFLLLCLNCFNCVSDTHVFIQSSHTCIHLKGGPTACWVELRVTTIMTWWFILFLWMCNRFRLFSKYMYWIISIRFWSLSFHHPDLKYKD